MRRFRHRLASLALLALAGCGPAVAWRGPVVPPPSEPAKPRVPDAPEPERRDLPPPASVRPCCAFGTDLQVDVGEVPVPWLALDNTVEPSKLGRHQYDNGGNLLGVDDKSGIFATEGNGLVLTCRGGFIDVAHVRDYADWTVFLASRMQACVEGGCVIALPPEGGERFLVVEALPGWQITPERRRATVVALARWAAFQLSVWHEIATGSGWSAFAMFPELASAFSPEDVFSNALGTVLGGEILLAGIADSEGTYNEEMTKLLGERLQALGALSSEATKAALRAIDGDWWDSTQRLPSGRLAIRRSFDIGPGLTPLELPREVFRKACGDERRRERITLPTRVGGRRIDDFVTLYVQVAADERLRLPGPTPPWITQGSFPSLIDGVRKALAKQLAAPDDPGGPKEGTDDRSPSGTRSGASRRHPDARRAT